MWLKAGKILSLYHPAQTVKFTKLLNILTPQLSPWLWSSGPSRPLAACPHEVCANSWEEDRGRVVPRNCGSGLLCALPCWENHQNQIITLLKIWTSGFVLQFHTHEYCDKYCADLYILGANLLVYSKLTDSFLHWSRFSIFERKILQLQQPHDHKKSPKISTGKKHGLQRSAFTIIWINTCADHIPPSPCETWNWSTWSFWTCIQSYHLTLCFFLRAGKNDIDIMLV